VVTDRDVDEPPVQEAFWRTLRRDPADPHDIARAYWRFTRASAPRRARSGFGRWLVLGFVAGVGAVSAATVARHVVARWTAVVLRDGSPAKPQVAAHSGAATRRRALPDVPGVVPPAAEVPSAVLPDSAPPAQVPAESASRHAVTPPSDERFQPPALDPKWRRVSEALRVNDYAAAETALRELETHGSAADRESASLSLSQVLLSRGRTSEARPRLERLSATARSSLVRQKARAMLADLKPPLDRSTPGSADTH